jgi:ATP-binding cassette subfamily B protein
MGLGYLINTVQRGSASLLRITEFLAVPPYETTDGQEGTLSEVHGDIEFRGLTFQYPTSTAPSLQDVTIRIPAGSTVGIVGRTGSGKTTLLKLLMRLYPVPDGQIFIGGKDINLQDFVRLRSSVGYVPQDAALFSATIAENIAFGQSYERSEVIAAAQAAVVSEDIDSRTGGFGTVLGEKGTRLSGGQRQRVAIARALIRQPSLLLMDDVFAALDYRTQAELIKNLRVVEAGRTTLIVSQRVAAVKHSRFILVMEGGRIVESGTHDALIAIRGLYYRLYEQQLAAGDIS